MERWAVTRWDCSVTPRWDAHPALHVLPGRLLQGGLDQFRGCLAEQRRVAQDQLREAAFLLISFQRLPAAETGLQDLGAAGDSLTRRHAGRLCGDLRDQLGLQQLALFAPHVLARPLGDQPRNTAAIAFPADDVERCLRNPFVFRPRLQVVAELTQPTELLVQTRGSAMLQDRGRLLVQHG